MREICCRPVDILYKLTCNAVKLSGRTKYVHKSILNVLNIVGKKGNNANVPVK